MTILSASDWHWLAFYAGTGQCRYSIETAGIGWHWADGLFAIAVSFYILHGAWEIGSQSIDALMDKQLPKSDEELILFRNIFSQLPSFINIQHNK